MFFTDKNSLYTVYVVNCAGSDMETARAPYLQGYAVSFPLLVTLICASKPVAQAIKNTFIKKIFFITLL
jgi:hypothetical protein